MSSIHDPLDALLMRGAESAGIGTVAGLGAGSVRGRPVAGAARGFVRGGSTGVGAYGGGLLAALLADKLGAGPGVAGLAGLGGAIGGGVAGWKGSGALLGKPKDNRDKEAALVLLKAAWNLTPRRFKVPEAAWNLTPERFKAPKAPGLSPERFKAHVEQFGAMQNPATGQRLSAANPSAGLVNRGQPRGEPLPVRDMKIGPSLDTRPRGDVIHDDRPRDMPANMVNAPVAPAQPPSADHPEHLLPEAVRIGGNLPLDAYRTPAHATRQGAEQARLRNLELHGKPSPVKPVAPATPEPKPANLKPADEPAAASLMPAKLPTRKPTDLKPADPPAANPPAAKVKPDVPEPDGEQLSALQRWGPTAGLVGGGGLLAYMLYRSRQKRLEREQREEARSNAMHYAQTGQMPTPMAGNQRNFWINNTYG